MERDVETLIDIQLRNKKWLEDPRSPKRNIYKQSVKTEEQKKSLYGKRPDYVLYQQESDYPLIVIEAKDQGKDLNKAMRQAIDYAQRIKSPIAIATDGIFLKTHHLKSNKPLYLNKEEVDCLLEHDIAIKFLEKNEALTLDPKVIKSREDLISIFKDLNNKLSEAGVRAGIERTEFFCNILFLKVIGEIAEQTSELIKNVPKEYRWNVIREKRGIDLYDFINKQALPHFQDIYAGEVLSPIKPILNYSILDEIIHKLDNLSLTSTNTDIKGDAFEFFLRNYGGADTDFGEYFTPRHIVKTLVKLLNPKYGERIYDPFCGTGGMLIESFKHIYDRMPRNKESIQSLKAKTIFGAEISEMSRIAKMNMILAGDGHSNIVRQDSYASPQSGKYEVVITNIPFGTKRKTKFSRLYGYKTDSSEITGILHCLDALSDSQDARAGIILPKGISNNKGHQYSNLRKQIVEQYELISIVSLNNSTFLPNTGVSADMYIIKKRKNKNQKAVWYFPVKHDGFTQDSSRSKVSGKNDIDVLLTENNLSIEDIDRLKAINFTPFFIEEIKGHSYSLDYLKYVKKEISSKYPVLSLKELGIYMKKGQSITAARANTNGDIPVIAAGRTSPYNHDTCNYSGETITISASGAYSGYVWYHNYPIWASDCSVLKGNEKVLTSFLFFCLEHRQEEIYSLQKGTGQPHVYIEDIENIKIPVPPQGIQKGIQKEIQKGLEKINSYKRKIIAMEEGIRNKVKSVWAAQEDNQELKVDKKDV